MISARKGRKMSATVFDDGIVPSVLAKGLEFMDEYLIQPARQVLAMARNIVVEHPREVIVAAVIGGSVLMAGDANAQGNFNNANSGVAAVGLGVNLMNMLNGKTPNTADLQAANMASQIGQLAGTAADPKNAGGAAAIATAASYFAIDAMNPNTSRNMRQANVYGQNVLVDQQNRVYDANTRNHVGFYNPQSNTFHYPDGRPVVDQRQQQYQQHYQQQYQPQQVQYQQQYQQQQQNSDVANKFDNAIRPFYDTAVNAYANGDVKTFQTSCKKAIGAMDRAANVGLGARYSEARNQLYQMNCGQSTNFSIPN